MNPLSKWICRNLCDREVIQRNPYPQQTSIGRITASAIVRLFDEPEIGNPKISVSDMHITDRGFKLVDIEHLQEFLFENPTSEREYIKEHHDCDDFAYILQGDMTRWDADLAFGIIHGRMPDGGSHAWNVCIGTDHKIWFVEPQTDKVWKPEGDWKIYLIVM